MTARGRSHDERGVVAILMAIMVIALIGIMAFVTDFGVAYSNQRRVQNGADAAALAVGRKIAVAAGGSDTCATIRAAYNDPATRTYASNAYSKNVGAGAGLVAGSGGFRVTCETVGTNAETVVVSVQGSQSSPSFLGGVFGRSSVPVSKGAKVIVAPLGSVVGLRPFAICKTIADLVKNAPASTFVVAVSQANAGCGTAPGNWAMMDFNGGSNPTGDMKDWIQSGYPYPVSANPPVLVSGDPGFNVNAAQTEMDIMMTEKDIVVPVYDSMTGNGNNAQYNIIGFMSVTPCRYKINSKSGPAPGSVNAACDPLPATVPSDYIQLRYSAFIPVGELNVACKFDDALCDTGPRGTALAD